MAVLTVPRPLQERLGEAATESLVEILRQIESDQEQLRGVQNQHLLQVLEERFLRHVAEAEQRTNAEIGDVRTEIAALRADLGKEIADVRADLGREIAAVRVDLGKEIADVRKEITTQTRWILAVLVGAAVLIPILQRVMTALIP